MSHASSLNCKPGQMVVEVDTLNLLAFTRYMQWHIQRALHSSMLAPAKPYLAGRTNARHGNCLLPLPCARHLMSPSHHNPSLQTSLGQRTGGLLSELVPAHTPYLARLLRAYNVSARNLREKITTMITCAHACIMQIKNC